jgi:hypothetical protein
MGVGGQRHAPAALPPGKRASTHCIGDWVGPRASLDGCGITNCTYANMRESHIMAYVNNLFTFFRLAHCV